jgi:hypothetical protein
MISREHAWQIRWGETVHNVGVKTSKTVQLSAQKPLAGYAADVFGRQQADWASRTSGR